MRLALSLCLAFIMDLFLGDPAWIPHPVVLMGKCISGSERFLRKRFPKTPEGERQAGRIMAFLLPAVVFAGSTGILLAGRKVHKLLPFVLNTIWCYQALAVRDMVKEAKNVAREISIAETLENASAYMPGDSGKTAEKTGEDAEKKVGGDAEGKMVRRPAEKTGEEAEKRAEGDAEGKTVRRSAEKTGDGAEKRAEGETGKRSENGDIWVQARKAVGRIVGRDTEALDKAAIIRATIETVAENFSDGVCAPLFYMVIGGAPLALAYKAVNTMDSMVGYRNEKYLDFGRAAAKLDDAANYVPSRLAALFLIAAACICEGSEAAKNSFRIWRRDRRKHPSPNSAQTESVMAGALGVRLLGPTWYFGRLYEKEWIGDNTREVETRDISKACRIFMDGSVLALTVLVGFEMLLMWGGLRTWLI